MWERLLDIEPSTWWNVIFLALTLFSIALAVYFYRKSLRIRVPVYATKSLPLIGPWLSKLEAISVLYNGEAVRKLSLTTIALWNRGREPIRPEDFATSDPLRVSASDATKILDFRIALAASPQNAIDLKISEDGKQIDFRFDYLGFNQGAVIEVFHTGNSGDSLSIRGTIRDAGEFKKYKVKDVILDRVFDAVMGWLPKDPKGKGVVRFVKIALMVLYIVTTFVILFPFLMVIGAIDRVLLYLRQPPRKEFLLE